MTMKLKPIKDVAEKVGIRNASHLRTLTGLGVGTCYQLWDGSATRFDLETLNRLCNVLQVGPAHLFDYTPDVDSKESAPSQRESSKARRSSSGPAKTKRESKQAKAAVAIG
jgi:DNA-binding Xre family transcriptional regulator